MPAAPLDSLESALQLARVRLNDAIATINGDVLTDTAAFTLPTINGAWRRLQELLVDFKYTWFVLEGILAAVPASTNPDAGSQMFINWSECFDGTNPQTSPVLPQTFISPLSLWERPAGVGSYFPMDKLDNGLPGVPKTMFNRVWEWRNGAIYLPGATQVTDIRARFAAFYADFVAPATTPFSGQPIPIMRAQNALAWYICREVAAARGDLDATTFEQAAQQAAKFIFNLDPLQAKSIENEAQYARMNDAMTPMNGPASRGMNPNA